MAAVTSLGNVWTTTAGNKAATWTPAVGDLIVIFTATSGIAGGTTALSDNNSDGLGAYTMISPPGRQSQATGTLAIEVWVRNAFIGSATSTIATATQASSTGGGLGTLKVTGMPTGRVGATAVRSYAGTTGAASTTPAPVLNLTPDTNNPVVTGLVNNTNPATLTARTSPGYTEAADVGYNSPATGLHISRLDSGETSATLTFGGTSPSAWAALAIELDTSAVTVAATPPVAVVKSQATSRASVW